MLRFTLALTASIGLSGGAALAEPWKPLLNPVELTELIETEEPVLVDIRSVQYLSGKLTNFAPGLTVIRHRNLGTSMPSGGVHPVAYALWRGQLQKLLVLVRWLRQRTSATPALRSISRNNSIPPGEAIPDGLEHVRHAVAILNIGGVDDGEQQQAEGVGHNVALAAFDLLTGVPGSSPGQAPPQTPPLSVVFTLWLSITPAERPSPHAGALSSGGRHAGPAAEVAQSATTRGRPNHLAISIHRGYAAVERYRPRASDPPSSLQKTVNHNLPISLNNF